MDTQSDFERDISARMGRLETALVALSQKIDGLSPASAERASIDRWADRPPVERAAIPRPRPEPKPHLTPAPAETAEGVRGADWWLARAGAALTVLAVILLFQYAVGRGWITPAVRVLTGVAIGAALMYWGRKIAPADPEDSQAVALRELMMGSAFAAWYISAFVASVTYQLVSVPTSRYLFLLLSIAGGALSLKERRSSLAIIAVGAGFLGPILLSTGTPSIPSYAFYVAVLAALSIVLYLMRGWQSVLWISFASVCWSIAAMASVVHYRPPQLAGAISLSSLDGSRIIVTLLTIAMMVAFGRAPILRRRLVATGSDRYPEPLRSRLAVSWLTETGKFIKLFSPAAGALDSLSVWVITLLAPLAGIGLLSSAWPRVSDIAWGAIQIALAMVAFRMCKSASDENDEITHLEGVAAQIWGTFGLLGVAHALFVPPVVDSGAVTLAIGAFAAAVAIILLHQPRFVAAIAVGRLMAGLGVLAVLFSEAAFMNTPAVPHQDRIRIAMSIAEFVAIGAGVLAWREMKQRTIAGDAANVLIIMSYAAFLLLDARVFGEIWKPLVTASFAVAGTTLLLMSRTGENKMQRAAGGATIVFVIIRLLFVDMAGVDTIWRVLLFLGVGALFLFTSRQLQVGRKQAPSQTP